MKEQDAFGFVRQLEHRISAKPDGHALHMNFAPTRVSALADGFYKLGWSSSREKNLHSQNRLCSVVLRGVDFGEDDP